MNTDEPLRLAALRLSVGEQVPEGLPSLAADALARGLDSSSLRMLAGAPTDEYEENRTLFVAAMHELGVNVPSPDETARELVRYWAAEIVAGALAPYEGARRIWWRLRDTDVLPRRRFCDLRDHSAGIDLASTSRWGPRKLRDVSG